MGMFYNGRLVTSYWFNSNGWSWCRSPTSCTQVNLTPNQIKKTVKEIYVDNKVRTVLKCRLCGSTTYIKAGIDTKRQSVQLSAPMGLDLKKYPHVYGVFDNRQQS